jgi:hypothetical protein
MNYGFHSVAVHLVWDYLRWNASSFWSMITNLYSAVILEHHMDSVSNPEQQNHPITSAMYAPSQGCKHLTYHDIKVLGSKIPDFTIISDHVYP